MKKGNKRLTSEEIEKIKELYAEGKNSSQIGRELNRDHATILFWLKRLKVESNPKPYGRKEIICPNCKKSKSVPFSSTQIYCSQKCYSEFKIKFGTAKNTTAKNIKYYCDKCKKEIPEECKKLNQGMCFICAWEVIHARPLLNELK